MFIRNCLCHQFNIFVTAITYIMYNEFSSTLWIRYYLQPRKKRPTQKVSASSLSSAINDENSIGSLRLKINYILDHVLPSHNYIKLRDLIIKNPESQPITSSAAYLLGEIIPCKIDAAQPLVRILLHYDQIVPTIRALAKWEISKVTWVGIKLLIHYINGYINGNLFLNKNLLAFFIMYT